MTSKYDKQLPDGIQDLHTTSAKIRLLTDLRWTRKQIADALNIRQQFVRNVQIQPVKNPK